MTRCYGVVCNGCDCEGMGSSGQVVGLLDKIICRISPEEKGENVLRKEDRKNYHARFAYLLIKEVISSHGGR